MSASLSDNTKEKNSLNDRFHFALQTTHSKTTEINFGLFLDVNYSSKRITINFTTSKEKKKQISKKN